VAIDESRPADDNLSSWIRKHDLHLVEFEDGPGAATFVANLGANDPPCRRQLDVCLVSDGLRSVFASEPKVKVAEITGQALGHRALLWRSNERLVRWLGLRERGEAYAKEQQRLQEAED
jgi:hypothetical protein